tara:strand:- start:841 stop:1110 length:270 start_codon:yes stop_codon:yes gene_type:complete
MKNTLSTIAIIFLCFLTLFGIIELFKLPNEHTVKEYRLKSIMGNQTGYFPAIRVVIENEKDEIIELPKYTMEQVIVMLDSLNKTIKPIN